MKKLYEAIKDAIGILLMECGLRLMSDELRAQLAVGIAKEMQPYISVPPKRSFPVKVRYRYRGKAEPSRFVE